MKLYLLVLIALFAVAGCDTATDTATEGNNETISNEKPEDSKPEGKVNATPKDAVQAFVDALEAKDEAALKAVLSEKTGKMLDLQTKITGRTVVDIFDSKEFEEMSKMPETRNEKIEGDKATLEVKDPGDDKWTPLEFVREGGSWKMAFADADYDKEYDELVKQAEKAEKAKSGDKDEDKDKESDADSGSTDKPAEK